jgi:hypothetical protein
VNKDKISKRHNYVQKKLGKTLQQKGYEVALERTYEVNQDHLRPDLTVTKDNVKTVIELAIWDS